MPEQKQPNGVVDLILRYGMIDGGHHKQWILDQVLRMALGEDTYNLVIRDYNDTDPEEYAPWDEGIAP